VISVSIGDAGNLGTDRVTDRQRVGTELLGLAQAAMVSAVSPLWLMAIASSPLSTMGER